MSLLMPPDIAWPMQRQQTYRPNWSSFPGHINDEHTGIWNATKEIPGWQDIGDSEKLYEMAYHCGSTILEIGTYGGRSAVVELRGALRAFAEGRGLQVPQFYGVDIEPGSIARTFNSLQAAKLDKYCLLFLGDLQSFHRQLPITPTMVFVDGDHRYEGVWADLRYLAGFLAPGTPVFCHDYIGIDGVTRAVNEWVAEGSYMAVGIFGAGALLVVSDRGRGTPRRLDPATFSKTRHALTQLYIAPDGHAQIPSAGRVQEATRAGRLELAAEMTGPGAGPQGRWPYTVPKSPTPPPTLPSGKPWPRISIVTPSYNYGRFVEETLLSVIHQNYPNVEHIFMDGGSTDNTMEIVERYRGHLAYVESEKDRGQSHAINKGFARATGEIFTWLNADDLLAPGALFNMALAFEQSDADLVAGIAHIYRDDKLQQMDVTSCPDGPLSVSEILDLPGTWMQGRFFWQPEVMFKRSLWEKAGSHIVEDLHLGMDYELWLRFALQKPRMHVIGHPIARFRQHVDGKSMDTADFLPVQEKVRDEYIAKHGLTIATRPATGLRHHLRIVFFNDIGFTCGAGIAHGRLAAACAAAGHTVIPLAATTLDTEQPRIMNSAAMIDAIDACQPDLVVLGNLHSAGAGPEFVSLVSERWPTVCTLHDLWPLTGRCAYTGGCQKYLTGCDAACPTPTEYPPLPPEQIAGAWLTKLRTFTGPKAPLLLANSNWTADFARQALDAFVRNTGGGLGVSEVHTMHIGIDLQVFRPRDARTCREALGLPVDRFIILTSASSVNDPRKGLTLLMEAQKQLNLADMLIVVIGDTTDAELDLPVKYTGYIKDPEHLAMYYAAADLFVGPSRQEAFGQVFIEAAACGRPSVAFAVGGVGEALVDGLSGRLAPEVSAESLADAIRELYWQPELRRNMGIWGRWNVENQWSYEASYQRFFAALDASGFRTRLGLAPKVSFSLQPHPVPAVTTLKPFGWTALSGFDGWEGPYPEQGLDRCRWMIGPTSTIVATVAKPGRYQMILRCRSYWDGRRIRIVHNGRIVAEDQLPRTKNHDSYVVQCEFDFASTSETIEFHHWPWEVSPRLESVLVSDFALIAKEQ